MSVDPAEGTAEGTAVDPAGGARAARPSYAVDPDELGGRDRYALLTQLVVPRPIAWVSTVSTGGVANVAPHSWFNMLSPSPPVVHFTSGGVKDTLRNVRATGAFVVNVVDARLAQAMNATSASLPADDSEFAFAGLTPAPCLRVAAPRVAEAAAALECVTDGAPGEVAVGDSVMVFGRVVAVHVAADVLADDARPGAGGHTDGGVGGEGTDGGLLAVLRARGAAGAVPPERLRAIGRMGGSAYLGDAGLFTLDRPS